jgi:hypothetical protein
MRYCLLLLAGTFAVISPSAFSQELLPDLAPASAAFRTNSTLLHDQKAQALEGIRKPYAAALDAAEQAATAAGSTSAIRAILKEREAALKGELIEVPPPELPRNLVATRKTCLRGIEKVHEDFAQRQKALDVAYLKTLATLQPKAAKDAALAAQIATEKQRVLGKTYGPITDLRTSLEGTTWKASTGSVWHFEGGKLNGEHKFDTPAADKVRISWSSSGSDIFTLDKDGKTLLVHDKRYQLVLP